MSERKRDIEREKQYYQENRSYLKMKSLENYYKNPYKNNEYSRAYYAKNKDSIREQRNRTRRGERKAKIARLKKSQESPLVKEVQQFVLKDYYVEPVEFPTASFSVSFA